MASGRRDQRGGRHGGRGGVAWRGGAPALLPISFALLAAAAAFLLDEPASEVVDVTPTGPASLASPRRLVR